MNIGKVSKKMKWSPTADGKGMFLSIQVNERSSQSMSLSLPITWGEIEVIRNIMQFSIPRLLAFDYAFHESNGPMEVSEESMRGGDSGDVAMSKADKLNTINRIKSSGESIWK